MSRSKFSAIELHIGGINPGSPITPYHRPDRVRGSLSASQNRRERWPLCAGDTGAGAVIFGKEDKVGHRTASRPFGPDFLVHLGGEGKPTVG